jgi:UDP-2-acetamido-2,6-beta-L-arabino-hexul-4-ose reductase
VKVVITGGHGFLGWHTAVRLRALRGLEAVRLGRQETGNPQCIERALTDADVVMHLAGVNRAESGEIVSQGNTAAARSVADAIVATGRPVRVVYANSILAEFGSAYGRGKRASAEILQAATAAVGGSLADVLLPNLFGEHGRPFYNSFVATFCDMVSRGETPTVAEDKYVPLMHSQQAAELLIQAIGEVADVQVRPEGQLRRVSEVLELIGRFHELYSRGEIPPLTEPFLADLFNTYRSYAFPRPFPFHSRVHADERGELFETVRSHGGPGQSFVSTTHPGATRGDHYHLHKVERFFVLQGEAEIALRRVLDDTVVRLRLSGDEPGFVDMPTLWTHNISNVGTSDLLTMFWASQLMDPLAPDQFLERVEVVT